ncbi:MAG: NADH:ubiquinone oxidoreductase subunit 5 (chain L)/multisubunit Na+/H+ antiporter, MnhA subunit, partial [Planctomycetaceae bacterium]|nr:NADH:ubiquinone oxidoreductase subunit 5 (chain L)/multisubunit Na+/H+ antiporter, MnhA subunit [Planctomycetaceae bacterium]
MSYDQIFHALGLCVVGAPAVLFTILGLSSLLLYRTLPERTITRISQVAIMTGLVASVTILAMMLALGRRHVPIALGTWVLIPHYHFVVKFEFDRLSVPFAILTLVLSGTIGAIASRYMHREPGYNRFFVLY